MFSINDVRRVMATPEVWPLLVASDLGVTARGMAYLEPDDDLHTAVQRFTALQREILPVLEGPPPCAGDRPSPPPPGDGGLRPRDPPAARRARRLIG